MELIKLIVARENLTLPCGDKLKEGDRISTYLEDEHHAWCTHPWCDEALRAGHLRIGTESELAEPAKPTAIVEVKIDPVDLSDEMTIKQLQAYAVENKIEIPKGVKKKLDILEFLTAPAAE